MGSHAYSSEKPYSICKALYVAILAQEVRKFPFVQRRDVGQEACQEVCMHTFLIHFACCAEEKVHRELISSSRIAFCRCATYFSAANVCNKPYRAQRSLYRHQGD